MHVDEVAAVIEVVVGQGDRVVGHRQRGDDGDIAAATHARPCRPVRGTVFGGFMFFIFKCQASSKRKLTFVRTF